MAIKLPKVPRSAPQERRLFLALLALSILVAGFIVYQIVTNGDGGEKESPRARKVPAAQKTRDDDAVPTADIDHDDGYLDYVDPPDADPNEQALAAGRDFVAAYQAVDRKTDPWYKEVKKYCEPAFCKELGKLGPSRVEQLDITGDPTIAKSTTTYLLMSFPTEVGATLDVYVGEFDGKWLVYYLEKKWG